LSPLDVGTEREPRVALGRPEPEELGHDRHHLELRWEEPDARRLALELLDLLGYGLLGREGEPLLHELDDRMEGCSLRVRGRPGFRRSLSGRPARPGGGGEPGGVCPPPASPTPSTFWPSPSAARSQRSRSVPSSSSRPTNGVSRPAATSSRLRTPLGWTTR